MTELRTDPPSEWPEFITQEFERLSVISADPEASIQHDILNISREYLNKVNSSNLNNTSGNDDLAATAAQHIDSLQENFKLPASEETDAKKGGWSGYLRIFNTTVLSVATRVRYDDHLILDGLVKLLVELRKLPARSCKVWDHINLEWIECELWKSDPIFPIIMDKNKIYIDYYMDFDPEEMDWSTELTEDLTPEQIATYKAEHALNLSTLTSYTAFRARCLAAGLDKGFKHRFDTVGSEIERGLDPKHFASDPALNGRVTVAYLVVAALYIIYSGEEIYKSCVVRQLESHREHIWDGFAEGRGRGTWESWKGWLEGLGGKIGRGEATVYKIWEKDQGIVRALVGEALKKMEEVEGSGL